MTRLIPLIFTVAAVFLFATSTNIQAAEIARFDDGTFAGMGFPFSESARIGDLLFLAGQIGEDADGKLVPGG